MSINCVAVSGYLTRSAQLRENASGTRFLTFSVAVNDRVKNPQTGDWENRPNFIDCVLFGSRAESLASHLLKGVGVMLHGKLRYSTWIKNDEKRSKVSVVVKDIDFMSKRGSADCEHEPEVSNTPDSDVVDSSDCGYYEEDVVF